MNKFFVHIPKNAGMCIRRSPLINIQPAIGSTHISSKYTQSVIEKMKETNDHPGLEHARWRDINPKYWKSYQPFAVIRNPWDRVVSRYFFAKKVIEVERKVDPSYADVSSFEAFLEERHKWGNVEYMWHRAVRGWYPAFDHVTDELGNIKCDLIRFENLNEDFKEYFNVFQDPKPRNVTALNKKSYTDIYTPKTIKIVADWYKKDIDTFGYDFDTGPTKNYWKMK